MMVRRPVIQSQNQPASQAVPYPITPVSPSREQKETNLPESNIDPDNAAPLNQQEIAEGGSSRQRLPNGGDRRNGDDRERPKTQLPPSLRIGKEKEPSDKPRRENISSLLDVPSIEATPRSSIESQRLTNPTITTSIALVEQSETPVPEITSTSHTTNPYHRRNSSKGKAPALLSPSVENSSNIWRDNAIPDREVEEQSVDHQAFAQPWIDFNASPTEQFPPERENSISSVNGAYSGEQTIGIADSRAADAPILDIEPPRRESQPRTSDISSLPLINTSKTPNHEPPTLAHGNTHDQSNVPMHIEKYPVHEPYDDDVAPPLPPRHSQEEPPIKPPRPPKSDDIPSNDVPVAQSQPDESAKSRRARETYQIRHVNWYDASSPGNLRRSPIMVQNANGPCPLLALVNALVLSTPADYATALVETLRVREQVSLGLLLDAVIDELIGRNGDLSDVSDMYAFLVTLHTGMNVNPRFVPIEAPVNLMDAPIDDAPPSSLLESRKAGGFEDTREMKLYRTFAIPLIHGWILPRNHPAFAALKRSAMTYEDAQNLMFREEDLEEKLRQQGLSAEEQVTLEDIASVKYFLSSTATQLTGYGLDTMTESMAPGSIAILFRNDHFSTLYRHPKSGQLLTLVTDMGYAGHDEVVWESLVDVSGEGCEFFSGDFRPVGNTSQPQSQSSQQANDEGWSTVRSKRSSRRPSAPSNRQPSHSDLPPLSTLNITDPKPPDSSHPHNEQEDHDLALAMQLQEEEEERDRQEAAARRREDELSQAYLNSSDASGRKTFPGFSSGARAARGRGGGNPSGGGREAGQGGPSPPPRGRGSGRYAPTPTNRPPTSAPPRESLESQDAPPPTYEQAAKGPAYHPPGYHPAHPNSPSPNPSAGDRPAPPTPPVNRPHRQSSAYSEHASSYGGPSTPSPYGPQRRDRYTRNSGGGGGGMRGGGVDPSLIRRRSGGVPLSAVSSSEDERKEKDCIVM
ncbi:hypothetical protein ACLMJK_002198 [Lecanora helva]